MLTLHQTKICDFLYPHWPIIEMNRYSVTKDKPNFKPSLPHNLVPRVLSYPPYFPSLLRAGRREVGESPGNEVAYHIADSTRKPVSASCQRSHNLFLSCCAHSTCTYTHSPPKILRKIYKYTFFGFFMSCFCIYDASNANVINWKVKK